MAPLPAAAPAAAGAPLLPLPLLLLTLTAGTLIGGSGVPQAAAAATQRLYSYPVNDSYRCRVGLTFSGLGAALSGDYMDGGGGAFFAPDKVDRGVLFLAFTWTDPNHTQHTPYGCDMYGCSAADKSRARGKWGVIAQVAGSSTYSLLAVCDGGCPDWKPSCADIYNQPPTESALHCPVWPATWNATQSWTVLNATDGKGDRR